MVEIGKCVVLRQMVKGTVLRTNWKITRINDRWRMTRIEGDSIAVRELTRLEKILHFMFYILRPECL